MKKKLISLLLTVVMLLMLLPTTAFAFDSPTLNMKTTYDAKSQIVTLKVTVGAVSDLGALSYRVLYDNTKLEVVSGSLVGKNFANTAVLNAIDNYVGFAWYSISGTTVKSATEVMEVKFSAKSGAEGLCEFKFDSDSIDFNDVSGDNSTSTPGAGSTLTANVTLPAAPKPVTKVELDKTEITLSVNGTSQLTATVTPADADNTAVRWQSKNTKIATVDNTGMVTGVKVGKTEVTATSCDGTKIVATCVVNVVACTHAGTIKAVPAKDATCTEPGNKAYYTCTKCGAAFLDAEGNQPTTVAAQTIAAKDHKLTETPAVKPDCKHDGKAAYWTCSECHKTFVKNGNKLVEVTDMNQLVIPSTGEHDWKFVAKSEKNGYTLLQFKCSGCDTVEWDAFVGCDVSVTLVKDEKSKGDLKDADVTVTGNDGSIKMSEGDTIDIENVNIADVIGTGADEDAAIAALKEKLENTTFTVKATAKKSGWKFDTVKTEVKFVFTDNGVQAVIEKNGEQTPVEKLSFTITGKKNTTTPGGGGGGSTTTDTTKTDGKKVESGKTFDAGIAMYVGLSVLSVTGGALVIGKKKERF
jgi:hypothetical protein